MTRLPVLLPLPLKGPLDYVIDGNSPSPRTFVRVPLSGREVTGVVWNKSAGDQIALEKLKPITGILDAHPLPDDLCRLIDWVADYTLSAQGRVLRMAMSAPDALLPMPTKTLYRLGEDRPDRMTAARERVVAAGEDGIPRSVAEWAGEAAVSQAVVRGLVKLGCLVGIQVRAERRYPDPDPECPGPDLSEEQEQAAASLCQDSREGGFHPTLLEGVTGSGKTEVYFEAIAEALRKSGAQVLVMLPEIALTAQWLERFEERFGARPTEWHSDLTQAERRRAWRAVAAGEARVVVGARSALFLPFPELSLIIIDEEHDASFKQEEGVLYNARDMAVVRASLKEIPIILATATPSLETQANVDRGRYKHLMLKERHGIAELPDVIAVDLTHEPPARGTWLSPPIVDAMGETLAAGEQTLLFLNRRGYAPLTLCRHCGTRVECPRCTAWLVEHRYFRTLMCHHCGYEVPTPEQCPECDSKGTLAACGPGVERLEEEVRERFPTARIAVMSSDTLTSPARTAALIAEIQAGAIDVIVGTQLVTKGYHFPKLTLVGVVDADLGLKGGDLRGAERTYQQLAQVAGRAGREERRGRVYLQTYDPNHPVTAALISGNVDRFWQEEKAGRERQSMPPYGRLAAIILSSENGESLERAGSSLARTAPRGANIAVLGPAPAPIAMIRGVHRHRMLVKATRAVALQGEIRNWLRRTPGLKGVRIRVDIDPYSFL